MAGKANTATAQKAKMSLADVLKQARSTEPKTKSSTPVLDTSDETRQLTQEVKDIKGQLDSLTSVYEMKGQELIDIVRPLREAYVKTRSFTSSVKIPTLDGMLLTIAFSSNYRKCAPENEDAIVSLIGQERYEKYFGVTNTIKVKADIAPQHLQELIDRVGAEDFAAFFEVSTNIKPNEMFKAGQFFDFKSEELKALEGAGVVPYKPSIKL